MSGKGDTYRKLTKEQQQAFDDNFDRIFSKKSALCDICGKELIKVTECAWTSCTLNWDEKRIDIIGQNSNEGLHYDKI
jgi:hypothetical protein